MDPTTPDTPRPPAPLVPDLAEQWMIRPDVDFLNHGSFGAMPKAVYDAQDAWRRKLEAEPIELIGRQAGALIDDAKSALGRFLRMERQDFGLVTNATEGVNAVLNSIALRPGDELVTTTHVYNAVRQAMRHTANRSGAIVREIDVPTPIASDTQIADCVLSALTDRTRLVVIDHVTSPTAIILPVRTIAAQCAARGVELLIDGAHAPGMFDLDIPAIGATYYTGNLHKWVCAPKGCAFLWVQKDRQKLIHPAVISHNLGQGLAKEFEWQGTRDLSAWLAAPDAIRFMGAFGWDRVYTHNHALAAWAHRHLCERWDSAPISPIDGSLLGSMATVRLPGRLSQLTEFEARAFQQSLYTQDRIEVPLIPWQGECHLRISCQLYNSQQQYERLARVIDARR